MTASCERVIRQIFEDIGRLDHVGISEPLWTFGSLGSLKLDLLKIRLFSYHAR